MEIAVKIVGVLHIIVAIAIVAVILLQQAKKPGMSGVLGGNMDNSYYGRNKGRTRDGILAKITAGCAILFLCTSLFLAYNFAITNRVNGGDATGTDSSQQLPFDTSDLQLPIEGGTEDQGAPTEVGGDEAGTQAPEDGVPQTPAE